MSVEPVAEIGTFSFVHTSDPPDTEGAVGTTESTVHL